MAAFYVGVASWFACSLFAFWLATRPVPEREKTGRVLVGIGALLVGYTLVLPRSGPGSLPPELLLIITSVAGLVLLIGLILAFPVGGLRSVIEREEPDAATSEADEPDAGTDEADEPPAEEDA